MMTGPRRKKYLKYTEEHKIKQAAYAACFICKRLFLDDRFCRALSCAGAALKAKILVDLVVELAHADRFCRALSCTGTAAEALVCNYIRHNINLRKIGPS